MAKLVLLNKPFQVMCQFTDAEGRATLADFVDVPNVYPAGRLDYDSEGLVLLTDEGQLQHRIASPNQKMPKTYWVQVEGEISHAALAQLSRGVELKDGLTRPAQARRLPKDPPIWPRFPAIRQRANQATSWIELILTEGRNRQVRRMTAAVGFPTLRLIRMRIGDWSLDGLSPGESQTINVHVPVSHKPARPNRRPRPRHPHRQGDERNRQNTAKKSTAKKSSAQKRSPRQS